ncbi:GNAT family N-acetyltransferase [Streptococcus chenjunshii]|uniref:GNAT family N-acetyltransferase n=1 Tax=Streptococcus chenjunshii TaxID=2173853 RepID=A0A372KMM8_9STRE|nr:GNAT family N-acetyltransferase [Streptococcus chenjunshii]AXQ79466.1 GNAT family N-acetyltransferase [Streptococcus chenjunshii]RFU51076.1 GNAT family N-acetyltransferase [Streptococcus chenjunshii]RFU53174.1 GNAT family N-acetyltransferase [Streptococcus chenjunshii]
MTQKELLVEEAQPEDAGAVVALLDRVLIETEFLTKFSEETVPTEAQMAAFLSQKAESLNEICLTAKLDNDLAGILIISSDSHHRTAHIGYLFTAVLQKYWGYGVGQLLMEAAVDWAEHSQVIRRLELTVQKRNAAAVHIYKKFGFVTEGTKKRGIKTENGEFLDVYLMSKLID